MSQDGLHVLFVTLEVDYAQDLALFFGRHHLFDSFWHSRALHSSLLHR